VSEAWYWREKMIGRPITQTLRRPLTATSAVQILTRDYKSVDEVWSDMEVRTRKEAAKAASRLAAQSSRTFA
jgi:hypothetical protein